MVYDVKIDLTRKARLVAGGHQTDVPKESVYSSFVSRDSVRFALMIASLNNLNVLAADVQNAYLNATKEKCYTIAGPEFGPENEGRPVLITRALYGLRSSGHIGEIIWLTPSEVWGFQLALLMGTYGSDLP
jgi:hypothetical protein